MHRPLRFKRIVWCRKRLTLWWYHHSQRQRWFHRRLRRRTRQTCHMIMPMARVSIKLPCRPRLQTPVIRPVNLAVSTDMHRKLRLRQSAKSPKQHHIRYHWPQHQHLPVTPRSQHQRLCARPRLVRRKRLPRVLHRRMRRRARHPLPHSCFPGSQEKLIVPRPAPPSASQRTNPRWTRKACD